MPDTRSSDADTAGPTALANLATLRPPMPKMDLRANMPIDVAVAADDAFAMPLAVTVKSALSSARETTQFRIHVIDGGLTSRSRDRLTESWRDSRAEVRWITPNLEVLKGLPVSGHVNATTYVRILLQHSLPTDIQRVIYLDSDLLVRADLAELWACPWEDVACLAAPDVGAPWMDAELAAEAREVCIRHLASKQPVPNYRELGFCPDDPYFNAGVIMVNLREWRRLDVCALSLECLSRHREFVNYWDQYALNVVLHGKWRAIDMAWNQGFMAVAYRSWKRSPMDRETYERVRFSPKIVHFTTGNKPWKIEGVHPFRPQYLRMIDKTCWSGWRPGGATERAAALLTRACRGAWRRVRKGGS